MVGEALFFSLARYFPNDVFTFLEMDAGGSVTVSLNDSSFLLDFVFCLRNHSFFVCEQLLDLWGTDFLSQNFRFLLQYKFSSLYYSLFLYLRVFLNFSFSFFFDFYSLAVDSVTKLFASASWLEREVWDMFGVFFRNHSDLRRLLTDYGFLGYPLRKDFPLMGFVEVKYSVEFSKLLSSSLVSVQEFRPFDVQSPWYYPV
jgi:NADH:ubiquinone oxidoreductase subunit C